MVTMDALIAFGIGILTRAIFIPVQNNCV